MTVRSMLFAPGDRPDRITKALAGLADIVVADLEDAVPPSAKAAARQAVATALRDAPPSRAKRAVRIDPAHMDADLAALADTRLDFLVVPKAEPGPVAAVGARTAIPIVAIIETASGVLAAPQIAALPCIAGLAFGAEDLAADAGLRRSASNAEVAVPRALVALAAAAHGKHAFDMITADYRDVARTAREAAEARALGYAGKMCIHPDQVRAVHEAFQPTADEVAWARRVVAAVDAAGIEDGGVVVVDGRMIDVPLVRQARRILADAAS